jgi:hypothetical protein
MLNNINSLNQQMYLKHNVCTEIGRVELPSLQPAFRQAPLVHMTTYHPHPDEQGKPVLLKQPSTSTPLVAWSDPDCAATVIPGGDLPPALNGIAFQAWRAAFEESGLRVRITGWLADANRTLTCPATTGRCAPAARRRTWGGNRRRCISSRVPH